MPLKVKGKQPNSKMCFVCGLKNHYGIQSHFYELENDELLAIFRPRQEYQSYPGRLHGGIAAAMLDETICRAIMIKYENDIWGVTIEMNTKFKKPVPLDEEIRVIGRITNETSRTFEGTGEILLPDGKIAVKAYGKYLRLPVEKITDFDFEEQEWRVVPQSFDPEVVDL